MCLNDRHSVSATDIITIYYTYDNDESLMIMGIPWRKIMNKINYAHIALKAEYKLTLRWNSATLINILQFMFTIYFGEKKIGTIFRLGIMVFISIFFKLMLRHCFLSSHFPQEKGNLCMYDMSKYIRCQCDKCNWYTLILYPLKKILVPNGKKRDENSIMYFNINFDFAK